jgi:release factor glutamine methyltransferase
MVDCLAITFGTLQIEAGQTVYEPAEDSFLLATYASGLSGRILDMGTGSGIVALSAAYANPSNEVIGADANPAAVECARKNARANNIRNATFVQSDMFEHVRGKFDAILFNPPYLPTTLEERLKNARENLAYDGGESGLEAFYRFAEDVSNYIDVGARVAVIATSMNQEIEQSLAELRLRVGLAEVVAQEEFFFERIVLIEAIKP